MTQPTCSCISCGKQFSVKGIHTHYERIHGDSKTKIKYTPKNYRNGSKKVFEEHQKRYYDDPPICQHCGIVIPYKAAGKKYCSRSCSAKATNPKKARRVKTKLPKPQKQPKSRICVECGHVDYTDRYFRSDKCVLCQNKKVYRNMCDFKFNLKSYPEEFDFDLLRKHGMFHPKTNPGGVARDHMYSVSDGRKNRIDPSVISHPANCQLLLQRDNMKKHTQSSISLEELLERIRRWDELYH